MTLITQQDLTQDTESTQELLKALQASLADLRRTAIALKLQIQSGETRELGGGAKEIASVRVRTAAVIGRDIARGN